METNDTPAGFKEGELLIVAARPGSGINTNIVMDAALRAINTPEGRTKHMVMITREAREMKPEHAVAHISAATHELYKVDRAPYPRGKEADMNLPEGKTCGDCVHIHRCFHIFGHGAHDEICDWAPSRFQDLATLYGPKTDAPTGSPASA